jgi:hypothetical protein
MRSARLAIGCRDTTGDAPELRFGGSVGGGERGPTRLRRGEQFSLSPPLLSSSLSLSCVGDKKRLRFAGRFVDAEIDGGEQSMFLFGRPNTDMDDVAIFSLVKGVDSSMLLPLPTVLLPIRLLVGSGTGSDASDADDGDVCGDACVVAMLDGCDGVGGSAGIGGAGVAAAPKRM